jgi:hypothetical protein
LKSNKRATESQSRIDTESQSPNNGGISPSDREQLLLDDIRVELERLADALERLNELLDEIINGVNR